MEMEPIIEEARVQPPAFKVQMFLKHFSLMPIVPPALDKTTLTHIALAIGREVLL